MNAWNIDADTIKLNDSWDNLCFITNDKIEEYLREDEKLFIIAAKGLGKTFVLKKKSKMKRDRGEGAIHIPKTELCEKIGGPYQHVIFGHEEFEHLNKINQWRTIWTLCIYIVVLNNIEKHLPENLKALFEHSNSITSILNIILDQRKRLHEFSREIDTTLRSLITNINQTVFLYIDNVDEAFNNYLNIAKNKPNQNIEGVWVYSQLGLMEAAKETLQCNRHIKVYASIRIEAYNLNKSPTFLQMKSYICFIKYSKEEVEKIFLKNVSAYLGKREEIKPTDLLKEFFGFIKIPHPVVKENNRPIQENIFDYLYRHTFGRPREIVYLGNSLSNPPSSNRTSINKIREIVNREAIEIMKQYILDVPHAFNEEDFQVICAEFQSNIIPAKLINNGKNKTENSSGDLKNIFLSLYRKGLLGYQKTDSSNRSVQAFLPVAEFMLDQYTYLPNSSYYFLHPAFTNFLQLLDAKFKLSDKAIIGYDYPFNDIELLSGVNSTLPHESNKYCVSFGAGKIGLGLIADLLIDQIPIAFVQRAAKPHWIKISKQAEIVLKRNGNPIGVFFVVSDSSPPNLLDHLIHNKKNILLLTENPQLISKVLRMAKFVTTSLGKGIFSIEAHLLNSDFISDVNIYPFENEYSDILKLTKSISQKNVEHVHVIPVSVDRVCSELIFGKDGKYINVKTEDYCDVVVCMNNKNVEADFEMIEGVKISKPDIFEFERRKKYYFVNGLHMVLVAYGISYLISEKKISIRTIMRFPTNMFLEIESIRSCLKVFGSLQCIRLLSENKPILAHYYHTHDPSLQYDAMMEYVEDTIKRFEIFPDEVGRLFPIKNVSGLRNKYESRIKQIEKFITDQYKKNPDSFKDIKNFSLTYDQINSYMQGYLSKVGTIAIYQED